MSQYTSLTSDIQVPDKWPVTTRRKIIIELVKKAIRDHPFNQRVVITIENVSALLTDSCPGHTLKRIEHVSDEDTCYIDLLLPIKTTILKFKPVRSALIVNESVPFLPEDLTYDHPISRLYGSNSTGHRIVVAMPNLKNILRRMDVTGEDVYNYSFETTYRNPKSLVLQQQFVRGTSNADPYVFAEKISDDEWDIVCGDRLIKPCYKQSWCSRNIAQLLMKSPLFKRR